MNSQGFDPKDLEEICSRKPQKYKMKKADYKELGRNLVLGVVDVELGAVAATAIAADAVNNVSNKSSSENDSWEQGDGWDYGNSGTGFYTGGYRIK